VVSLFYVATGFLGDLIWFVQLFPTLLGDPQSVSFLREMRFVDMFSLFSRTCPLCYALNSISAA
jgi:hypothetical protein